jgi:trimeric autotransporter adhesin
MSTAHVISPLLFNFRCNCPIHFRTPMLAILATTLLTLWSATYAWAGTTTPSDVSVSITPGHVTLLAGQSAQFTATVAGTTNTAVTWSLKPNVGSLLQGLYTAPTDIVSPLTVTLTAASAADPAKSATVALVVNPVHRRVLPPRKVSVSVSPARTSLNRGQSESFTARVSGTSNTAVTWSLNPSQLGKIANGVYQAPTTVTVQQTVLVTATSVADPAVTARATIMLQPIGLTIQPTSMSLGAAASTTFTASVSGTSDTAVTWSLDSALGTVVNGVYTAPAAIVRPRTVTLTAASVADPTRLAMATITLTPTQARLPDTPHFGNDGTQLTSYVPGKSMFVRSVFFSMVPQLSQYVSAFKTAQLNTLETGFYVPPGNNFKSVTCVLSKRRLVSTAST